MDKELYFKIDRIGLLRIVPQEWIKRNDLASKCRKASKVKFNNSTFSTLVERLVRCKLIEKRNIAIPTKEFALMIPETVEIRITELGIQKKKEFGLD